MLTEDQRKLRDDAREFVRSVPPQLILDMDADRVQYPRDFVRDAAQRKLLGLRFPAKHGGRGLGWKDEIVAIEEVGVLGTSLACAYVMPSIVGEALNAFGTDEQKESWLRPLLTGEKIAAEALTEPRGGSDFFGTTRGATGGRSLHPAWSKTIHCRRCEIRLFPSLRPHQIGCAAASIDKRFHSRAWGWSRSGIPLWAAGHARMWNRAPRSPRCSSAGEESCRQREWCE